MAAVVRLTSDEEKEAEPVAEPLARAEAPEPAPAPAPVSKPLFSRPPRPERCRLILAIGDDDYAVRPIAADPGAGVAKALRLRKADGTVYDLAIFGHGPECDCPDFTFRRDGIDRRGCKHLRAARAAGLLN